MMHRLAPLFLIAACAFGQYTSAPAGPPPSPLERRLAELEGKVARLLAAGDAVVAFEERISRAERRLFLP